MFCMIITDKEEGLEVGSWKENRVIVTANKPEEEEEKQNQLLWQTEER